MTDQSHCRELQKLRRDFDQMMELTERLNRRVQLAEDESSRQRDEISDLKRWFSVLRSRVDHVEIAS